RLHLKARPRPGLRGRRRAAVHRRYRCRGDGRPRAAMGRLSHFPALGRHRGRHRGTPGIRRRGKGCPRGSRTPVRAGAETARDQERARRRERAAPGARERRLMLRDFLIMLSESSLARSFTMHAPGARSVARRFVAGETIEEGIATARALNRAGMKVTLDYLGESVSSREEAREAADTYLRV